MENEMKIERVKKLDEPQSTNYDKIWKEVHCILKDGEAMRLKFKDITDIGTFRSAMVSRGVKVGIVVIVKKRGDWVYIQ